jgi:hypothetical protein
MTLRTTSQITASISPSHQRYAAITQQATRPPSRVPTEPAQVTEASPGKYPVTEPSARAKRSRTPESSRWLMPTGPLTAVSSRACSRPAIRLRAAVPSAPPTGSLISEIA